MSVINKMLQELDRRNATAGSEAEQPPQQVKVITPHRAGREWFWRLVAVLMLAAVAWVAWVAVQLQPRPALVTEQAFRAAEQAHKVQITGQAPIAIPSTEKAANPAGLTGTASEAPKPAPREPAETLRLAQTIQTPIPERQKQETPPEAAVAETPRAEKPAPAKPAAPATPSSRTKPSAPPAGKAVVDKRERVRPSSELAETHFRRAAVFLNQGRVSEAEEQLVGAMQTDPGHVPARQAYVALLLEQQRLDAAKRVLRDGLGLNPGQPTFALALARILAEQRDYAGALEVIDRAGSVGRNADFLAVRGAALQRLSRHAEALEAFQTAVGAAPQPATTWVNYAISLEAVGRKGEAAQAYRRALGAGPLPREVHEYADARIRALD